MGVQSIYPQLLVEYLACEDKYLHILMLRLQLLANLHTDGCASTKTEVEKHKIGLVGCEHFPERVLRIGCSYNLCLGHLAMLTLNFSISLSLYKSLLLMFRHLRPLSLLRNLVHDNTHPCRALSDKAQGSRILTADCWLQGTAKRDWIPVSNTHRRHPTLSVSVVFLHSLASVAQTRIASQHSVCATRTVWLSSVVYIVS